MRPYSDVDERSMEGVQFCLIMHGAFVSNLTSKNGDEFVMWDVYCSSKLIISFPDQTIYHGDQRHLYSTLA